MAEPAEWQCTCGAWVPVGYSRHPHFWAETPPSFSVLHDLRRAQEAGLLAIVPDSLAGDTPCTFVLRTKEMSTR